MTLGYLVWVHTCFVFLCLCLSFHLVMCPESLALWLMRILFSLASTIQKMHLPRCTLLSIQPWLALKEVFCAYHVPPSDGLLSPPVEDTYASAGSWIGSTAMGIQNLILFKRRKHVISCLLEQPFKDRAPIILKLTLGLNFPVKASFFPSCTLLWGCLLPLQYWFKSLLRSYSSRPDDRSC